MNKYSLAAKLLRSEGLACSIHRTDHENCTVVRLIMLAFCQGVDLQFCERNPSHDMIFDIWKPVTELPLDFSNYKYKINPDSVFAKTPVDEIHEKWAFLNLL